ncbi:MAG: hemerythrin domain-containing protein [Actinomycetota bacterium]|nr:hemerythrin domain-containing protein [Actinomycetota bacterium]
MDAIVLLKNDHKTVEKLFKQFEKAGESAEATKGRLVKQIIEELSVHAFIEEQIFYPEARLRVPETEDHVLESLEEHHIVKWVLAELAGMDPSEERFDAKVTVLAENVRHHVTEEEQEWFPEVRKAMGRKELGEIGARMEQAKKTAPREPRPLASDDPLAG